MTRQDALEQLARHGKTFNWARRFLGRDMGLAAAALYAFCRHVDDIADGDKPGGGNRLSLISDALAGLQPAPDAQTEDFLHLAASCGIDVRAAQSLMAGLLSDQKPVAVPDEAALLVYAYRVAGTVGLMMAPVLACRTPDAHRQAIDLGIAMQLTNIARDIAEDAAMGRRYVPADWCDGADAAAIDRSVTEDNPLRDTMQAAVVRLLDLADIYYASGYRGLAALPLRAHVAIGVAGFCYQAIGHKLRRRQCAYWQGRTVVGVGGKVLASLRSLATLRLRLSQQAHRGALHNALRGELYEPGQS